MDPSVSPADLVRRSEELSRREQEVAKGIKRARTQLTRSQAVCSAGCWRVAVSILCFCDGDTKGACDYVSLKHLRYHEPAALKAKLEQWWDTSTSHERQARSVAPVTAQMQTAAAAAQVFLTESELHTVVEKSNLALGVAAVTGNVIKGGRRLESEVTEPAACLLKRGTSKLSLKKRMQRWRKNEIAIGSIAPRETEPLETTQNKVAIWSLSQKRGAQKEQAGAAGKGPGVCPAGQKRGPDFGLQNGPASRVCV